MEGLGQVVTERIESGSVGEDLTDILGEVGGRPEDLFMFEDGEGLLYLSEERRPTSVPVVRVEIQGESLAVEEVSPEEFRSLKTTVVSTPETASADPAYD